MESRPEHLFPNSPMWNYGKSEKYRSRKEELKAPGELQGFLDQSQAQPKREPGQIAPSKADEI